MRHPTSMGLHTRHTTTTSYGYSKIHKIIQLSRSKCQSWIYKNHAHPGVELYKRHPSIQLPRSIIHFVSPWLVYRSPSPVRFSYRNKLLMTITISVILVSFTLFLFKSALDPISHRQWAEPDKYVRSHGCATRCQWSNIRVTRLVRAWVVWPLCQPTSGYWTPTSVTRCAN